VSTDTDSDTDGLGEFNDNIWSNWAVLNQRWPHTTVSAALVTRSTGSLSSKYVSLATDRNDYNY
jgi:hypothetical protein